VYYKDAAQLHVWRGLPESPEVLRSSSAGDVRALAISDDGSLVAVAADSGITMHSEAGALVIASGDFSALAFLPGSRDLLAAEPGLDRVLRITGEGFTEFAGTAQGVAAPQGLAASRDGKHIAVAGAQGTLILNSSSGAAVASAPCECSFTTAQSLKGDAVFLITAVDGGQWVLDIEGAEARLVYAGARQ
jgi:hypothetical protein